jgi:hypothetical protein
VVHSSTFSTKHLNNLRVVMSLGFRQGEKRYCKPALRPVTEGMHSVTLSLDLTFSEKVVEP